MKFVFCTDHRCNPVPVLENALPNTTSVDQGVIVSYQCIEGHRFDDGLSNYSITCDGNQWIYNDRACQGGLSN